MLKEMKVVLLIRIGVGYNIRFYICLNHIFESTLTLYVQLSNILLKINYLNTCRTL